MSLYARTHLFTVLFVCAGIVLSTVALVAADREVRIQRQTENFNLLLGDLIDLRAASFEYILYGGTRPLSQVTRKMESLSGRLGSIGDFGTPDAAFRMRVSDFRDAFKDSEKLLTEMKAGDGSSQRRRRTNDLYLLRSQQMLTLAQTLQRDMEQTLLSQSRVAKFATVSALGVMIALALVAIILMRRSVLKPLHRLTAAVESVGAGNRGVRLHSHQTDEFGRVANAFDRMLDALEETTVSRDRLNTEVKHREEAQQSLQESEARLRYVTDAADIGYWTWNPNSGDLRWSPRALDIFGIRPDEPLDYARFLAAVHEEDRARVDAAVLAALGGTVEYDCEFRTAGANGAERWVHSKGRVDFDETGQPVGMGGVVLDVTQHKEIEQRLHQAALHDSLTGLPNRLLFFEYGRHLLAAAQRHGNSTALLFIDLDRFKPINDTYGHETGDAVLREVAKALLSCTRQEDLVGRLGGDEFVIMLGHIAGDSRRAVVIAEHVVERLSRPIAVNGLELSLSASVGLAHFPEHGPDVDNLLHAADLAMYQAKRTGRAGYHIYTPELDRNAEAAFGIEMRLKEALRQNGLRLQYQPLVDVRSGKVTGAEALLRVGDGNNSDLSPQTAISIAEATGLIDKIGDWVITEACRQISCWHRAGLTPIPIAVNVSPIQLKQQGFAERLCEIVENSKIPPECLHIEVTESAVMDRVDRVAEVLGRVRARGMGVSLDDFGTGYSSLSVLSSLPLDKLKIDQSFVRNLKADRGCLAVTRSIIGLATSLELEVVAEGVESEEDFGYLERLGCQQAQGYLLGRPMTAETFAAWIATGETMRPRARFH